MKVKPLADRRRVNATLTAGQEGGSPRRGPKGKRNGVARAYAEQHGAAARRRGSSVTAEQSRSQGLAKKHAGIPEEGTR